MLSSQYIILLACSLLSVESVILGRRRSSQSSWNSYDSWGNNRRSSYRQPARYSWESPRHNSWGWNWSSKDYWGSAGNVDTYSNSGRWNTDTWATGNGWDSWSSWNSGSSRWSHNRRRQRSRARSHASASARGYVSATASASASATATASHSHTNNAWYYQMVCKNSYQPLTHANGNPYYCSWYSPCPQNGGSTYWYTYKYKCQRVNDGSMGLCCIDTGENGELTLVFRIIWSVSDIYSFINQVPPKDALYYVKQAEPRIKKYKPQGTDELMVVPRF